MARLYAKFLTSVNILTGNKFVKTLRSRFVNDEIPGAKKHIETIVNVGEGAFFLDEVY